MDIQKVRSMIQQVARQSSSYESVSIFDKKFSPYVTIGEVVIEIDNGIMKFAKKSTKRLRARKLSVDWRI